MGTTVYLLFWLLGNACCSVLEFPTNFEFGASTSAYQVEGAWNVSDKGESIWDRFTHTQLHRIADRSTGDVACDSYNQWQRDVEMAEELGLQFYRFSISWTRLLPTSIPTVISEDGKDYYNDLIDGLLAKGIEPVVTLYHFDLPQRLQDLGGWANPITADWFADYARVAFHFFGDRVSTWITINEPLIQCHMAYDMGLLAPGIVDTVGTFLCAKHMLMGHAKAWRVYDKEFRKKFHGKISLTNQIIWMEANTPGDEHYAEIARQFGGGLYSHPIFSKKGGWPPLIEKLMAEKSEREGYPFSLLPPFTRQEKKLLKGTYDFYGLNYYTSRLVRKARPGETIGLWPIDGLPDFGIALETRPEWDHPGGSPWFYSNPPGFRKMLNWIKKEYGNIDIAVFENGYPQEIQEFDDNSRARYIRDHLEQVLLAIIDGVKVIKYAVWSLMDNFEWSGGYTSKFGLYDVDFSSPSLPRTARKSARVFANITRTRILPQTEDLLDFQSHTII